MSEPFFVADEEGTGERYFMNHCAFSAKLEDDFMHGDVGAAFFPDDVEGCRKIKLFELPVHEPLPVRCCYMIGGEAELEFAGLEP